MKNTLFEKYGTILREHDTEVSHQTYGTSKTLTPLQFAWYETAIKANSVAWANARNLPVYANTSDPAGDFLANATEIALRDGFRLLNKPEIPSEEASKDYYKCVDWITQEGLYYDLLD